MPQMAWHSGVNSDAVLRLTGGGRGGGGLGSRGRGGSVDRGRGRGRGGYGYRAGYDDGDDMGFGRRDSGPPGYLRGKSFDRSHVSRGVVVLDYLRCFRCSFALVCHQ